MRQNMKQNTNKTPINDQIKAQKVRLIHEENNMGLKTLAEALEYAASVSLDLVQMNDDRQPVCKVFDYGKHKYEQQKKQKEQREKSRKQAVHKEMTMRPVIGDHDFNIKLNHIVGFVDSNYPVTVTIQFRNRELQTCSAIGKGLLEKIGVHVKEKYQDVSVSAISQNGRDMSMVIRPSNKKD